MVRVGTFICHCGKNIAGAVDPKHLLQFAKEQQDVVFAKDNKFLCSEQGQEEMKKAIKKHKLDRVVIAACGTGNDAALVRVSGKVTWNCRQLTRGSIHFIPDTQPATGDHGTKPTLATGRIDEQGNYSMMTRKPGDGVMPGKYLVMIDDDLHPAEEIASSGKTDKGVLPRKFANTATSGLTATINPGGGTQEINFTLRQ